MFNPSFCTVYVNVLNSKLLYLSCHPFAFRSMTELDVLFSHQRKDVTPSFFHDETVAQSDFANLPRSLHNPAILTIITVSGGPS